LAKQATAKEWHPAEQKRGEKPFGQPGKQV